MQTVHSSHLRGITTLLVGSLLLLLFASIALADQGDTVLVSVSSSGEQGRDLSYYPAISADGRYIAFHSDADLAPNDRNGRKDVFLHDLVTGETVLVSVSSSGEQGREDSGYCFPPSISADGRYIAFESAASNLVPGDTNDAGYPTEPGWDVFVRDRLTNETVRISVSSSGEEGNNASYGPCISADGRYIAFWSYASNLVPGDTDIWSDVFVHDRVTGATERVSISSLGEQGNCFSHCPSISADGRYVAFESQASNLVLGDTNDSQDTFVYDRVSGQTERVSVSSSGGQRDPQPFVWPCSRPVISAGGRYVVFRSQSSNLVPGDTNGCEDIFVRDRLMNDTIIVSVSASGEQGDDSSSDPSISADGRYIAFCSSAANLAPDAAYHYPKVFMHDRVTGSTVRVSVASAGAQCNGGASYPSVSADGRYVAFHSAASNLVSNDTNMHTDVFVHQYLPDALEISAPDGWLKPGWNYFSIPLAPTSWPEASDLLGFDCKNILYQWDPLGKTIELYPDDFTDLVRGRGYILRLTTDQQPSYEAYAPVGDFEIPLPEAGRTMIGHPFNHDTPLESCLIRDNASGVTRTALEDRNAPDPWINWNFVSWGSSRRSWELLSLSGGDDIYLRPWHGYIVWANVRDLTLIVPAE